MFDTIESVTKQFTIAVTKLEALGEKHRNDAMRYDEVIAKAADAREASMQSATKAAKLAANINKLLS